MDITKQPSAMSLDELAEVKTALQRDFDNAQIKTSTLGQAVASLNTEIAKRYGLDAPGLDPAATIDWPVNMLKEWYSADPPGQGGAAPAKGR